MFDVDYQTIGNVHTKIADGYAVDMCLTLSELLNPSGRENRHSAITGRSNRVAGVQSKSKRRFSRTRGRLYH